MVIRVAGRVYDGASGRGLGGVLISNGEWVGLTDDDGRYALELVPGAHRFVVVTVPSGYRAQGSLYGRAADVAAAYQVGSTAPAVLDFSLLPAPERARP